MEKDEWLEFLSARLRSQMAFETSHRAETWALALISLFTFSAAVHGASELNANASAPRFFLFTTKVLFLALGHLFMLLGIYLPSILQHGKISVAAGLGVRDFTSLVLISLVLTFDAVVLFTLSSQLVFGAREADTSNFFLFTSWINFFFWTGYFAAAVAGFASLIFFPNFLVKAFERLPKITYFLFGFHIALFLLMILAYSEIVPLAGLSFLNELRMAGLFWIFMASSLPFLAKLLQEPVVPSLAGLELDIASGRLERHEDILARFESAFVLRRLFQWIRHTSNSLETKTHEILRFAHDAATLADRDKPTELDLRQVEERYRKAEQGIRRLEKESQRFILSTSLFHLSSAERLRVEAVKDQFSRQLRHTRLEVAGVRKKIDDKLIRLKNSEPSRLLPAPIEELLSR